MEESKIPTENQEQKPIKTKAELIAFAYDLGFAIIIPLVLLGLGGRWLDRAQGTSPLFLICGLLLSLISTGIIIVRKVKKFSL